MDESQCIYSLELEVVSKTTVVPKMTVVPKLAVVSSADIKSSGLADEAIGDGVKLRMPVSVDTRSFMLNIHAGL